MTTMFGGGGSSGGGGSGPLDIISSIFGGGGGASGGTDPFGGSSSDPYANAFDMFAADSGGTTGAAVALNPPADQSGGAPGAAPPDQTQQQQQPQQQQAAAGPSPGKIADIQAAATPADFGFGGGAGVQGPTGFTTPTPESQQNQTFDQRFSRDTASLGYPQLAGRTNPTPGQFGPGVPTAQPQTPPGWQTQQTPFPAQTQTASQQSDQEGLPPGAQPTSGAGAPASPSTGAGAPEQGIPYYGPSPRYSGVPSPDTGAAGGGQQQPGGGQQGGGGQMPQLNPQSLAKIVQDFMRVVSGGGPQALQQLMQDVQGLQGGQPGQQQGQQDQNFGLGGFAGGGGQFPGGGRFPFPGGGGFPFPGGGGMRRYPQIRPSGGRMPNPFGMFPPGWRPGQGPGGGTRMGYAAEGGGGGAAAPASPTPMTGERNPVASNIVIPRSSIAGQNMPSGIPTQATVDPTNFRAEITRDQSSIPETRSLMEQAAWMVNGEVGANAPIDAQIVQLETARNRALYRNQSLGHALLPSRRAGDAGYYDGRSASPTYRASARPTPEQLMRFKTQVWDPVMLQGSNKSDVGWGPMTGNASAGVAMRQLGRGTLGYKLRGGDTYFRELVRPGQGLPTMPAAMAAQ